MPLRPVHAEASGRLRPGRVLCLLAMILAGCSGPKSHVLTQKGTDLSRLHRVVIMPFTDDPLAPASGLKAAAFFEESAAMNMKRVEWISPARVLKDQGIDPTPALQEDTVADAPGAIEPALGRIFTSTQTIRALNPVSDMATAQKYQADAVVTGALLYEPGTGPLEGLVSSSRKPAAALAIHLKEVPSGRILLAFQQEPQQTTGHPTENQLLQDAAEAAAQRIGKAWR